MAIGAGADPMQGHALAIGDDRAPRRLSRDRPASAPPLRPRRELRARLPPSKTFIQTHAANVRNLDG
ncbi:MAG TPA: hypothetical protein VNM50_00565 [Chloroflexota bacterium]|nr:hypothetical protein [Chloroflexota bacterium]